jgi:hypothetical protein
MSSIVLSFQSVVPWWGSPKLQVLILTLPRKADEAHCLAIFLLGRMRNCAFAQANSSSKMRQKVLPLRRLLWECG